MNKCVVKPKMLSTPFMSSVSKSRYSVVIDKASANSIAQQLAVPVQAELLPTDKLDVIQSLRQTGRRVAMVGDGINDAPGLAAANIGIAMGCGADISRDAADVCLLSDDLTRIAWSIQLARATTSTIKRNLFWAFSYNGVGVIAAACGLLNPIVAAVAMVGSSLFVITCSLQLATRFDTSEQASEYTAETEILPPGRQTTVPEVTT